MLVISFVFHIFLLNVLIAFTTIAYTRYALNSNGIYLTKIIGSRGAQASHPNYGCYLANLTPADIVLVPFIPFAIIWEPSEKLNSFLEKL